MVYLDDAKAVPETEKIPVWGKLLIPFGGGLDFGIYDAGIAWNNLIIGLTSHQYTLGALLFLFLLKFLFAD